MSRKIEHNVIANASIYIDGTSMISRAEEIKLPDITMVVQDLDGMDLRDYQELSARFRKSAGLAGG